MAKIDYNMVEKLATIQCTHQEIASCLGCSLSALTKNKKFYRIYEKGIEQGKIILRRNQWQLMEKGNAQALVWLGKQYLDQREKQEVKTTVYQRRTLAEFFGYSDDDEQDECHTDTIQ